MIASTTADATVRLAQGLIALSGRLAMLLDRCEVSTRELLAMLYLRDHGPAVVGDLGEWLGIYPAATSRVVSALTGCVPPLIAYRMSALDRRQVILSLLPAGEAVIDEAAGPVAGVLARLTPLERHELGRLLARLAELTDGAKGG